MLDPRNGLRRAPGARGTMRDLLLCVSLANLHFLNVWIELTNTVPNYYRQLPPRAAMIGAVLTEIALLTLLLWCGLTLIRRVPAGWARPAMVLGVAAALVVPANIVRTTVAIGALEWLADGIGRTGVKVLVVGASAAFIVLLWYRTVPVLRGVATTLMVFLPLLPILFAQAVWAQWRRPSDAEFANPLPSPVVRQGQNTRFLWLMFDELDYRIAFAKRPEGLSLPALDKLRAESFSAARAVGAGYGTYNAVPSMLSGQRVVNSIPAGPREILLAIDPAEAPAAGLVGWSGLPSVFSDLRRLNWSTSVVGWYHPYCRVLASHIDQCTWQAGASIYDRREYTNEIAFRDRLQLLAGRQMSKIPLPDTLALEQPEQRRRQLQYEEYLGVLEHARTAVGSADFVYVHWPIPHPFGIYDRRTRQVGPNKEATYLDNLALTDAVVGEFRALLEAQGSWDDATVLVSSDHSLRPQEWERFQSWTGEEQRATGGRRVPHVPFLVKLPRQRQGVTYADPFSIVLTHDLILALATGQVQTPAALRAWLDANRTRFPLPPGA